MSYIGIISALSSEGRCLSGKSVVNQPFQINEHTIAIICGMGRDNVDIAAQKLLEKNVTALISWGTAGALTEKVRSGDLVLADTITAVNGESYSFDTGWHQSIRNRLCNIPARVHCGMIAHTEQVLKTPACKIGLHAVTHAIAVDMESIVIARVAHKENLHFLAVRAIVDEVSQSIPEAIVNCTDMFGRPVLFSLLSGVIKKPDLICDLVYLAKGMKAATMTLNIVARSRCLY